MPEALRMLRLKPTCISPRAESEDVERLLLACESYGFSASREELAAAWLRYSASDTNRYWQPLDGYTETMLFRRLAPYFDLEEESEATAPSGLATLAEIAA